MARLRFELATPELKSDTLYDVQEILSPAVIFNNLFMQWG